jgi:hypothetical protein
MREKQRGEEGQRNGKRERRGRRRRQTESEEVRYLDKERRKKRGT